MTDFVIAEWPFSEQILALTTSRVGGASAQPYHSFNLGLNCGDNEVSVIANRHSLTERLSLPQPVKWLSQTHSTTIKNYTESYPGVEADAIWSSSTGQPCVVLSADCLPVLLADENASVVAAVHCGWRGLAAGVLDQVIATLPAPGHTLHAWLGPAIGPNAFEVGQDVLTAFCRIGPDMILHFKQKDDDHWMADLYGLARSILRRCGVEHIYGGQHCTYHDQDQFYSYRRDGVTGRMASLIMIK